MSKVLSATCVSGVVTAEGAAVLSADILSEGIGPSEGILVMEEDDATYVTSNSSDLKSSLGTIADSLTTIATTLTSIAASMTGPTTAPPPTLPANVAQIIANVVLLSTLKETLK